MTDLEATSIPLVAPFKRHREEAWTADVDPARLPQEKRAREAMVLREDGRRLGPGNAMEADICQLGAGRFAVWKGKVVFSTSDNSDPNVNGRDYALTAPPAPPPPTMADIVEDGAVPAWSAPERTLRCAIIGVGARGAYFARMLKNLAGVEVAWLADRSADRIAAVDCQSARQSADLLAPLADPELDAVFVTTPDALHREVAEAAFRAGKHVFLEKPVATTLPDALAIMAAWKASGRVLQLGYILRETPFFKAVRGIVREGRLGRILTIQLSDYLAVDHGASYMRRWHRRTANSGGLIVHKGCHDLDIICWLLEDRPATVVSLGGSELFARPAPAPFCSECLERAVCPYEDHGAYEERTDTERADPTAFGLDVCVFGQNHDIVSSQIVGFEMTGGTRGVYTLAMQNPTGSRRNLTLLGEFGRLDGDFADGSFDVRMIGAEKPLAWRVENLPAKGHGGGDDRAVQAFLDACAGRRPPEMTSAEDAMRGLAFAFAAEQARAAGTVVRMEKGEARVGDLGTIYP